MCSRMDPCFFIRVDFFRELCYNNNMKRIIIPLVALIGALVVSVLFSILLTLKRKKEGKPTRRARIVIFTIFMMLLFFGGGFVYFSIYSHAAEQAMVYMESTDTVSVSEISKGYYFDGPGTEDALVFYPGAKVDEKAYSELMMSLADDGIDCFLISMPFHMAFLGKNIAGDVIDEYSKTGYKHWYICGHSLGGAIAANYAAEKENGAIDGIVMLAAYATEKLPEKLKVMTVIATNDHVINMEEYEKNRKNLPADSQEIVIQGGNHSRFGDYGEQAGDGEATISRDEQIKQVCESIVRLVQPDYAHSMILQEE